MIKTVTCYLAVIWVLNNFDTHEKGMRLAGQQLEDKGWVVTRAGKGKDDFLQINRHGSTKSYKIKIKALSGIAPVPFYTRNPNSINVDYFVICRNLKPDNPEFFTATKRQVEYVIREQKDGFWLETKDYGSFQKGLDMLDDLN